MNRQIIELEEDLKLGACAADYSPHCSNCRLAGICLPFSLEAKEVDQLDSIIQRGKPLQKGQHLYRESDRFESVFAVRSGTLKAYRTTDDGREQVTGFYFPGEILGMDGIANNAHASSARALETAAVCEIPFSSLEKLSATTPHLQRHFFQLMSREIAEDQQLITLLSKSSADERVAALLLSISARNARRKLSASHFRLSMSRVDIGNYLGLTVETVSRVFSRMQKLEALRVENKEIEILDLDALRKIADMH
ncbi:MAG: fumarate/nitrate reduction transcriptional regulator Fnr [Halieaceae bacterium]|jgi:CRP/FNR family transcriptional regulator|nr:fumarate/nitrate reduction transcriptional regulator Fnr [Halieaceae bacterium]